MNTAAKAYLDSRLVQLCDARKFFAGVNVGIVGLLESIVQLRKLLLRERCTMAASATTADMRRRDERIGYLAGAEGCESDEENTEPPLRDCSAFTFFRLDSEMLSIYSTITAT